MDICKANALLFTFSNVTVAPNTAVACPNETPDPGAMRRSQEFYDALNRHLNIRYWACGRFGQREYSRELAMDYAKKMEEFVAELRANGERVDFSIQMSSHPNIQHPYPYFIVTDYWPYMDLSMLDDVAMPDVSVRPPHEADTLLDEATGTICFSPTQRHMALSYGGLCPERVSCICSGIEGFVPPIFSEKIGKNCAVGRKRL